MEIKQNRAIINKFILIMLLCTIIFAGGCSSEKSEFTINNANDITVFYGCLSYAMFGARQDVIDHLVDQLNSLEFQETKDQQDYASTLSVTIFDGKIELAKFSVDANGVFELDGKSANYKIISGSFDYEYLKDIYESSKTWTSAKEKRTISITDTITCVQTAGSEVCFE